MPAIVIPAPISSNHAAPVTAGGTGATTAAAARTNLDVYSKSEVTSAIAQSAADVIRFIYVDVFADSDIAAGAPGTRGAQKSYSVSVPSGYEICSVLINYTADSSLYIPVAFMASGLLYVNWYRATTSSILAAKTQCQIKIGVAKRA